MGRPGLTQHRKFRRLERSLGSAMLARGALELLWETSYENGDEYLGDSADVEAAAQWTGEAGKLTTALLEAGGGDGKGFIEEVHDRPGRYLVHDLWHHAPEYVRKRRKREAERRAKTDPVMDGGRCSDSDQSVTGKQHASPDRPTGVGFPPAPAPAAAPGKSSSSEQNSSSDSIEPTLPPKKKRATPPSDKALRLATKLHDEILRNKPDFHFSDTWLNSWGRTADLMMTRDGRSYDQISAMIRWAQNDHFWKSNILSMDKLREQFDRLEMAARSQHEAKTSHGNGKPSIAEVIEREQAIARARTH